MIVRQFVMFSLVLAFVVAGLFLFDPSATTSAQDPATVAIPDSQANHAVATGGEITIRSSAVTAGGVKSSGGAFSATSASGQPAVGVMSGGKFSMTGGIAPGPAFLAGDCEVDGAVNLLDYRLFESCWQGPNQPAPSGCRCFDLDASDTLDLIDFAELANGFTDG